MTPRFFYGYVILALCFANMVVMRGVNGAFGVYYLALLDEFSWSRSDGASIASINFLVYALAAPIVGMTFDRLGPRLLMPLGAALVGGGFVLSSFAASLPDPHFFNGALPRMSASFPTARARRQAQRPASTQRNRVVRATGPSAKRREHFLSGAS